jgi:acyl-coenzyme A synthetase/AMP-(fatty) acid ligase
VTTTILEAFDEAVERHGTRTAIIEGSGRAITYDDLALLVRQMAAGYAARGVEHGDRIVLAMPVGIELYASLAALWGLGATVVFPEPAMGLKGLRHAIGSTRPKAFLSSGWYRLLGYLLPEALRLPRRLHPVKGVPDEARLRKITGEDIALISFTSGSTGKPKAIARSHAFMMAQNDAIAPLLAPRPEGERDLVAFPVFVLVGLALGITCVLPSWKLSRHDRVTACVLHGQIERHEVTRLLVPPAICETLARADSPPPLASVFTGGGPVFPDTMARLKSLQPKMRIVAIYGSTEAEPIAHLDYDEVTPEDLQAMKTGKGLLAGKPVDAVDLRIENGEILVAGAHVNEAYLDRAQEAGTKVRRDGRIFHRTGDAGRIGDDGRLWLLGRMQARVTGLDPFAVETAARFWPGATRSALATLDGQPVLAIAGEAAHLGEWKAAAQALGVDDVRPVAQIPLDSRHRSKTDNLALQAMLRR